MKEEFIRFRLPAEVKDRLEKMAVEQDRSLSSIVRLILLAHLNKLAAEGDGK
jgi:predicted DNA-binding protein